MKLPWNGSKVRLRKSRRKPIEVGLMMLAATLFVRDAAADSVPTGLPASPTFGITKFSQPLPRFDVLRSQPVSSLVPAPTAEANTTQQPVDPALGGGSGPIEGRPPGPIWAHQDFTRFPPKVAYDVTMEGAKGA